MLPRDGSELTPVAGSAAPEICAQEKQRTFQAEPPAGPPFTHVPATFRIEDKPT
jgi:hypothetical protein